MLEALRVAERFGLEPAAFVERWGRMPVADRVALLVYDRVRRGEE